MANERLKLVGKPFSVQLQNNLAATEIEMAQAINGAAHDIADTILVRGRADIKAAGNFGARWLEGLTADVEPKSGVSLNATITVSHAVSYFDVFQSGARIKGNLLWIPFSYTRLRISARNYARVFGGLFYAKSKAGLPMLFSMKDRKPKYFGVSSVNIAKKFHTVEIGEEVAGKFDVFYSKRIGAA
jgi:hypothetical protein